MEKLIITAAICGAEVTKAQNPAVKVVAVEPKSSAVLSTGVAGTHKIQGIGAGFVPEVLDTKIYDEIIPVENDDAFAVGKEIGKREGVLVGISSGAAVSAAGLAIGTGVEKLRERKLKRKNNILTQESTKSQE